MTEDYIAIMFGFTEAVHGSGPDTVPVTTAEDAAEAIADNAELEILDQSPSQVAGLEGVVIEVENRGDTGIAVMEVAPGTLQLEADRRLWTSLLDAPEGVLAIMISARIAAWEEAIAAAEPVLASVQIVRPP
ncbi:MAG: hypothetical protein ACRDG7_00615 [Candidatus Limnocylindria bacterium]